MKIRTLVIAITLLIYSTGNGQSEKRTQILILQSYDHHDSEFQAYTFEKILHQTGNYHIDKIVGTEEKFWYDQEINFKDYDLIVSSGLGHDNIPMDIASKLEQYIKEGGNMVLVHQGVTSFASQNWPVFQKIIGFGWYGSASGTHTYWDDSTKTWIETPRFHGVAPAHGKQHEFVVQVRDTEHPITKGIPLEWMHGMDEFYHGMRGSKENVEILATAFSDINMWGSGRHEPIAWTSKYGAGRVFVTVLGHVFQEKYADGVPGINSFENKNLAIHCVGFQSLFARGVEWAATGSVSIGFPWNFPTKEKSKSVDPSEIVWKK
ncbi:MAG: ThuA domain-containing protein [Flavobacteriaceae bacterium]|nr:MAG: ThuA domain-containing protein [Flavobacteriaceae bacterium]